MAEEHSRGSEASQSGAEQPPKRAKHLALFWRAVIEIGFIIFLFFSNLLMGEFARSRVGPGITMSFALRDIFTATTFAIGLICALIGFVVVEYLRKKI